MFVLRSTRDRFVQQTQERSDGVYHAVCGSKIEMDVKKRTIQRYTEATRREEVATVYCPKCHGLPLELARDEVLQMAQLVDVEILRGDPTRDGVFQLMSQSQQDAARKDVIANTAVVTQAVTEEVDPAEVKVFEEWCETNPVKPLRPSRR